MTASPTGLGTSAPQEDPPPCDLRERIGAYLRAHHVASVATVGPQGSPDAGMPHAASVFYATDAKLRLIFLSKGSSRHGRDIHAGSPVAFTVTTQYDDWRQIQGVQLAGTAAALSGAARAGALAIYVRRFRFVQAMLTDPRLTRRLAAVEVFRVTPHRAAFTDNRRGLFGQEVLDHLAVEP